MNIRDRWIDLLLRAAKGTKKTRTLLTPIGVAIFGFFTAVFVFFAVLVDRLLDLPRLLSVGCSLPVAVPVMIAGVLVTSWSAIHFIRVKGTPVPFNPPPKVVATGPYRFARNPMLTGIFILLLGIGLAIGSISLVFLFLPLFVLLNIWELRAIEEPELLRRLGDKYRAYKDNTPMFIPGFRTKSKTPDL